MKLMIELSNNKRAFRILDQHTGYIGQVSPQLYEDEDIAIYQRAHTAFHSHYQDAQMRSFKMVLYLRGSDPYCDRDWIFVGNDMIKVLYHLRKAFSDFIIYGADKIYLGG
jgi:hypothetical protein